MQAAFITESGPPECIQFGELPDPSPGSGEVLIKTEAVAVNPIDTYIRSGAIAMPRPDTYVVGCDVAGEVLEVGSGVDRFQPGDRVWGTNQGIHGRQGTFSEKVVAGAEWLYPIPNGVSSETAAAAALVSITVGLGLYQHAKLQSGETFFVNGGSGGVGSIAVQTAKAMGAKVITTAGSDDKAEYCRSIGADLVLDYRQADMDEQLNAYLEENGKIDLWWETLREPNLERTIPLMEKRGRVILMAGRDAKPVLPLGPFYTNDLSLIGFAMFNATSAEQLAVAEKINKLLANGALVPPIGLRLPLSEAAEAHRQQEAKTLEKSSPLLGKIVLSA
ncbi:MAG: NADPH:quinone reductase [Rubinisphaera brasiliensis]|uniref:NADPH:quinone reductase n=1 Tax=Rubinisphaera brasiliensis TaxID=119 RepID=UPI00391DFC06